MEEKETRLFSKIMVAVTLSIILSVVLTYAAVMTYTVQSDNSVRVKILPTPTQVNTSSYNSQQPQNLTAHLTISAETAYVGQDVKITATLDKPVAGITLNLRWMEYTQPTFNDTDAALQLACEAYLANNNCQTATTDNNGVAVFDLGTGLPVNSGAFAYWSFRIMPQDITVE